MDLPRDLLALLVGFAVALVTTPVGVSGAVFLLPVQLSVLDVPGPRVTPTNLLFNVVSAPAALLRHRRRGRLDRDLARALVLGSVPGVVVGALVRVHLVTDPDAFRLLAAAVLAPVGLVLLRRAGPASTGRRPGPGAVRALAFGAGVVGGIYGIGGGSVVGPVLVAAGMTVAVVAPAALLATWVASLVGVAAYAVLSLDLPGPVGPDWSLGVAAGLGGLAGGWLGAVLQPRLPEVALRRLLGVLALGLAGLYVVQALG
ncbi:TSUP family transporter [Nocardioides sp. zg-DK7169]|uniref:TSUP family transporter n=1 Tax=Nocardioides sp. zg-DK7169 TaxID=2736600 RepID=UPI001554AC87|nr:TSUP family transporter [Nocardioides sp. zg-DK7169]NPC98563.1 TSUP family transporter [Nocardioides sp. zg-DK7169]